MNNDNINNPNNPVEAPKESTVHKLEIDKNYQDKALEQVKKIIKGNKFDIDKITLANFEGEVLQFPATTTLQILTKISRRQEMGRVTGPVQVGNEIEADQETTNEYLKIEDDINLIRQIKDSLISRKDKGFAQDNIVIDLPFWKKEFVYFNKCKSCKATGKIRCQRCAGKGVDQCPRCNGTGMSHCTQCRGAQMITGPQGNKIQCPTCHGRGRVTCVLCNQSGKVQCPVCRTKGTTICTVCQGHGWSSNLQIVELEAKTKFSYPKEELPEKVVAMVDKLGPELCEYAEIHVSQIPTDTDKQQAAKDEQNDKEKEQDNSRVINIPVRYEVILPYGHAEFDIDGKSYYIFLFGNKGKITHCSPFLEDIIKNGMRKLDDAVEERGDVADNLKKASEYKTMKDIIIASARLPLMKAVKKIKERYPIGIKEETIKDLVVKADKSLKKITDRPRQVGLMISLLTMAVLFGAYFLTPLRSIIVSNIPNTSLHIVIDLLLLGAGAYTSILIIQGAAAGAMRKAMAGIVAPGKEKKMIPKLGTKGFWAMLLITVIFLICVEMTRHLGTDVPAWYQGIVDKFV